MEIILKMDLYPICRLCQRQHKTTFDMFRTKMCKDLKFSDAFAFVTNLNIEENDGLPSELCSECATRLRDAYELKRQALQTDQILHAQLIQRINKLEASKKSKQELTENRGYEIEGNSFVKNKVRKWVHEQNKEKHLLQPPNEDEDHEKDCSYVDVEELEELDMRLVYEDSDNNDDDTQFQENNGVEFLRGTMAKNQENDVPVVTIRKRRKRRCVTEHKCQVCERIFARKSNLVDHLRLHAKVKLFQCSYCEKSFVQIANFRTHMRTHTRERPFKCNMCSKAYSQTSALKIHIRSHTQERNYVCSQCGKAFTNASDLSKHVPIHDPHKQFQCNICQRHFAQKVNMLSHQRRMHSGIVSNERCTPKKPYELANS